MKIEKAICGMVSTNTYFIEHEGIGYLLDAPDSILPFITKLKEEGKRIDYILLSHGHFDHTMGLKEVLSIFPNAKIYISPLDFPLLESRNREFLASFGINPSLYSIPALASFIPLPSQIGPFMVIPTPGHTNGSVCFYSPLNNTLFSGDTLFYGGEGRTDLGGNRSELYESLKKLLKMDEKIVVLPGHGEETTIEKERMRLGINRY